MPFDFHRLIIWHGKVFVKRLAESMHYPVSGMADLSENSFDTYRIQMVLVFATVRLILFPRPHDKFRKTIVFGECIANGVRCRWRRSSCVSEKSTSDFRFPAERGL